MIIVDKLLEKLERDKKPIRVGMTGAGFMAKGLALQVEKFTPGMRLAAVANKTIEKARAVFEEAGVSDVAEISLLSLVNGADESGGAEEFDRYIDDGKPVVTYDPMLLCRSKKIDVVLEMTGSLDYGAKIVMEAIKNKKHVVSFNAELDGTIGPILKYYAQKAGVIYTLAGGDQPGVIMDLYRHVKGMGLIPVLCGNIKGLHDPYRNPTTQEGFAKKWRQNPTMVTSFADGTKISFEQAVVGNATGMRVGKRGMYGPTVEANTPVEKMAEYFPESDLNSESGIVDYVVGAYPPGGVFVLAKAGDERQKHYLSYYKMNDGPFYCFYVPYHLCHLEIPSSIARAVLLNDETISPKAGPMVEVVAAAKKNLKKGEKLDMLGGYTMYGVCENFDQARKENLLPIGLAEGVIVMADIEKDRVLTFEDVRFEEESYVYKLWREQKDLFLSKQK
jgi:predicted homoserine dehydrogenase-like protein